MQNTTNRPDLQVSAIVDATETKAALLQEFADLETKLHDSPALQLEDPNEWKPRSVVMTMDYRRKNETPALVLDGIRLINKSELCTVIAAPGAGKTNLFENTIAVILATRHMIDYAYHLGVSAPAVNPHTNILACDLERPTDDIDTSHRRVFKRLGKPNHIIKNNQIDGLDYISLIEIENLSDRRKEIEGWLESKVYDYLLLDGGLDLVEDMNDAKASSEAVRWIRAIAARFNVAVIITLHPNKNSETAAGHFGTYLHRWSRAFLLIKPVGTDGTRVVTTDFDLGKLSHDNGKIEHYFSWNPELGFFTSLDSTPILPLKQKRNQSPDLEQAINEIFNSRMTVLLPATDLKPILLKKLGLKEYQVKLRLAEAVEFGYLEKIGEKKSTEYRLVTE